MLKLSPYDYLDIIFIETLSQYICLTSLTRAKPKEKMEFPA